MTTADISLRPQEHTPVREKEPAADRFMRTLLRVKARQTSPAQERAAHRGFRFSLFLSAIRCVLTYVALPFLLPLLSITNAVTAPLGILLCVIAAVSGIASVRRFWITDYHGKWVYTIFIAVVLVEIGRASCRERV